MRILITNDDGIAAPALPHLVNWAKTLGEVTVVAPKIEQSGKSQAIDFFREVEIKRTPRLGDTEAWAMDSTPADCVRFGITGLKKKYDLVISGINKGFNLGHDIAYSGTVGAIMEAARLGVPAIAFSMDYEANAEKVIPYLDGVLDFMNENGLWECGSLYNVNIPNDVQGICITRQGGMFYSDAFEKREGDYYIQVGDPIRNEVLDLTVDTDAIWANRISISPLTHDRTDKEVLAKLMGR
jgi:5'-nucleotidase